MTAMPVASPTAAESQECSAIEAIWENVVSDVSPA
jgi:hypothetical protein